MDKERNKPSLKVTLSGGMRGLMEELEKSKSNQVEDSKSNLDIPVSDSKSFSETLDYYKRISGKSPSVQVLLDADLKRKLELLRMSKEFNCTFKALLGAIVQDFITNNKELIERNMKNLF